MCSISVVIKEMQAKSTMQNQYTPIRMFKVKKKILRVSEDVEHSDTSIIAGRRVN